MRLPPRPHRARIARLRGGGALRGPVELGALELPFRYVGQLFRFNHRRVEENTLTILITPHLGDERGAGAELPPAIDNPNGQP